LCLRPRSGSNRPHTVDSGAASPDAYAGINQSSALVKSRTS